MKSRISQHTYLRALLILAVVVVTAVPALAIPCCSACENFPDPDKCYRRCSDCLADPTLQGTQAELPLGFAEILEAATANGPHEIPVSPAPGFPTP